MKKVSDSHNKIYLLVLQMIRSRYDLRFLYPNDAAMREKAVTDAYMTVREFLRFVG